MIKFLWSMIWGHNCDHQWKILSHGKITDNGNPCGTFYNLQCIKCGDVKRKNLES